MTNFIKTAEIGMKIRILRQNARLSQEKLAELVGVTPQQIQKYEAGRTKVTTDRIQSIAEALGVQVSVFFHDCGADLAPTEAEEAFIRKLRKVKDRRVHESLMVILDLLTRR